MFIAYTYIISNAVAVYKKTMNEILDIALTHTTRSAAVSFLSAIINIHHSGMPGKEEKIMPSSFSQSPPSSHRYNHRHHHYHPPEQLAFSHTLVWWW